MMLRCHRFTPVNNIDVLYWKDRRKNDPLSKANTIHTANANIVRIVEKEDIVQKVRPAS